jgi:hypothetical protein
MVPFIIFVVGAEELAVGRCLHYFSIGTTSNHQTLSRQLVLTPEDLCEGDMPYGDRTTKHTKERGEKINEGNDNFSQATWREQ